MAVRLRQPFTLHVAEHYASTLALCAGRLAEAEAAAQRSHEWSRLLTGRAASGIHGIQMFGIRREQGRLAELAAVTRVFADSERSRGAWRPGFAALLAELGMDEEARRELARMRQEGLDELRATLWVASLTYLADACAAVGDEALAALLYPELAPLAGGNVVIGHGVACYGAADRYLGLLAATLGDHDRAVEHFEQALAVNRDMGATTWVAHTLYAYGRTLRIRGASDDAVQASELLSEAATLAERIGMPVLLARARALGARIERARMPPDDLSWRELDILRLVAVGPQQPRDRRGALHQRAHRRQPRTQHPAQDRRCEPHRGGGLRLSPRPGRQARTRGRIAAMPVYVIERSFAEQLDMTSDDVKLIEEINADEGVSWLFSFLSADRHRSYCLYEAPSPDAIIAAAKRAGIPADAVTEVNRITADTFR